MLDIHGFLIKSLINPNTKINLSELNPGKYYLKIIDAKGITYLERIIKNQEINIPMAVQVLFLS